MPRPSLCNLACARTVQSESLYTSHSIHLVILGQWRPPELLKACCYLFKRIANHGLTMRMIVENLRPFSSSYLLLDIFSIDVPGRKFKSTPRKSRSNFPVVLKQIAGCISTMFHLIRLRFCAMQKDSRFH